MGIFESLYFFLGPFISVQSLWKESFDSDSHQFHKCQELIPFYKNNCRIRLHLGDERSICYKYIDMIMVYLLEDDDDKLIALSYSFIKVWRRFLLNSFLSDWVQAIKDTKTNEVNNKDTLKDVLFNGPSAM